MTIGRAPGNGMRQMERRGTRAVRLGKLDIAIDRRADGTIYLANRQVLGPYARCITERLVHWAAAAPQRIFMAERDTGGAWRRMTYGETLERVRCIGAALLGRGLSAERPLLILSGNDIEHALLALAALHVGIPYAPVSPAYAQLAEIARHQRI